MYIDSTGETDGRFALNAYQADILEENAVLITTDDIDEICGQSIVMASEVEF